MKKKIPIKFEKLDRTQLSYTKELYGVRPTGSIFFKGNLENGEPVILISVSCCNPFLYFIYLCVKLPR